MRTSARRSASTIASSIRPGCFAATRWRWSARIRSDILVDYRISSGGISVSKRQRQLLDRLRLQIRYFAPLQWRCWTGVAKTLMLFAVPRRLVTTLKAEWRSRHAGNAGFADRLPDASEIAKRGR